MKTRAALLYAPHTPVMVEEIDIDEPKAGEVRVKIEAAGLCHTDLHYINGDMMGLMPIALGHEGAGIVESVGDGVNTLQPGDHVLMGVTVNCGKCPRCAIGQPYWCDNAADPLLNGTQFEGTSRLSKDGETIYHCFSQSSFADYVVASATGVIKIRDDAPFEYVCGLGCGVGAGLGAVINNPRFRVEPGASIAVFGCGSAGLSVIMGAKLVSAQHIVAIDVLDNKLALAKELGATLTINAAKENVVERTVLDIGPVDFAFDCVGKAELVEKAYNISKPNGGTVIILGAFPMVGPGSTFELEGFNFIMGKAVVGCSCGFMRPAYDYPRLVNLYMSGYLPLDKIVTHRFKLEDINKGMEALSSGEATKVVIIP